MFRKIIIIPIVLLLGGFATSAQQYFRVFHWETLQQGWAETAVRNVSTFSGIHWVYYNDHPYNTGGMMMNTANIAYGLTDQLTIGVNTDFLSSNNLEFNLFRFRADALYRFGHKKNARSVNPALYLEYGAPVSGYDEASNLELRLILMKDAGDFRITANPAIAKAFSGPGPDPGLEANFYGGIYWRRYHLIQPGFEYYGRYGEISDFPNQNYRPHHVFATVDVRFYKGFLLQLGGGYGLNFSSDEWIGKFGISYEFQAINPRRWRW